MRLRNTSDSYGAVPQALHWAVAVLVVLAWLSETFGDVLPRGTARAAGLFVHMSAGLAIIALVVLRLAWRLGDPPPPPEKTSLGDWAERASQISHYALYALLVAIPIVGIVLQFARGDALAIFGLFHIASPWAADRGFAHTVQEIHAFLANGIMILAGIHAAAALAHHWIFRDRTLLRMLPGMKR
jgi:cytochrome b561